jgi:hypothetical protein
MITFDEIWAREFEPLLRDIRQRENDALTESLLEATLTLGGEPVRQMTPRDMLHLDAFENPFIGGATSGEVHFLDVAGFVWELHVENTHTASFANLWRRSRFLRRLARHQLEPLVDEIVQYVDRMLLDISTSAGRRPKEEEANPGDTAARLTSPKTHFLAPLLVEVASQIGHVDPMTGTLLAHTPIPRLIQYRRVHAQEQGGKTYTELDSLRNRCIERLNEEHAKARAAALA